MLGAVVPVYNIPGVTRRAEVHRPGPRRHLPRQDHQVERPGDREAEPRRQRCRRPTSPSCTAPTARARPTSGSTTCRRCRRSGRARSASRPSVNWPVGVGGKGNEGVAGLVTQTPGSIGYVELIYALQNKISYGSVQNAAGEFVKASVDVGDRGRGRRRGERCRPTSASRSPTRRARASIRSRRSPGCCSTRTPKDKAQAKMMVDFVKWALTDGQKFAPTLGYAPLPASGRQAGDGGARARSRSA